ncbi:hypothetical protein [Maribacter polysaccharolyticus]|uniref:hypothetical protein n=1 Tax=Maribacter polysaccharolyticus TaxID=3020831 RepID=UPI00237F9F85|nr:hypothetical protein [Maribacter polysaccharolyticus]MDE3742010.1 hypothetical protein [Maribacter polysaccharolyticus]
MGREINVYSLCAFVKFVRLVDVIYGFIDLISFLGIFYGFLVHDDKKTGYWGIKANSRAQAMGKDP